jgi:hypothetical protein
MNKTLTQFTVNLPGDTLKLPTLTPPPPMSALQGLMEATSNFGVAVAADWAGAWARIAGAFIRPTTTGGARAAIPATASAAFLAKFSLTVTR